VAHQLQEGCGLVVMAKGNNSIASIGIRIKAANMVFIFYLFFQSIQI